MLSSGSGIYAPAGARAYSYNMKTEDGHLLIAELDAHPRLSPASPPAVSWNSYALSVEKFSQNDHEFTGIIFGDPFTFVELTKPGGNLTVCQKDLCCHLGYKMTEKRDDEVYVLGAFDGLHVIEGQYYLQVILWRGLLTSGSLFTGRNLQLCGGKKEDNNSLLCWSPSALFVSNGKELLKLASLFDFKSNKCSREVSKPLLNAQSALTNFGGVQYWLSLGPLL